MKSKKSFDKLRGGYYTPQAITEFICKWIINKNTKNILEPSCGDGNFLKAIVERQEKLNLNLDITGVELCLDEAKKAMRYGTNVECQDFFAFYRDKVIGKSNYDAIVGNPPFIRYQDFDEKSRDIAFFYMKENGFHPTKLTNIWLPFLVLSCLALSENGRLGMVIPAELFQVNYAGETREFLARYFDRLTLITFQKLVFEEIQQEVILLLGEKKSADKEGDLVKIDAGLIYKGYHSDAARTYAVGEVSPQARKLMDVTRECFFEGLKAARAGNHLNDISKAIGAHAAKYHYGIVRDLVGHGIGTHLHEDPQIPNFPQKRRGVRLMPGMTLAVEPMINLGRADVAWLDDEWTVVTMDGSLSAHYENTILITDGDPEILTLTK